VATKAKKSSKIRNVNRLTKTDMVELANYLYSRYDNKYRDKIANKKGTIRDKIKSK